MNMLKKKTLNRIITRNTGFPKNLENVTVNTTEFTTMRKGVRKGKRSTLKRVGKTPNKKLNNELKKVVHAFCLKRDDYTCIKCGKRYPPVNGRNDRRITPSHFWSSTKWGTKFNPMNIDALCFGCHTSVEHDKQGWYREFKLKQLGQRDYEALAILALGKGPTFLEKEELLTHFKELLASLEK